MGAWVGDSFNETQPVTVDQLSTGQPANDILSLVMTMNAVKACASGDHSGYYQRYPLAPGQADYLDATACTAHTNNFNELKAKASSNNRSKYIS